MIRYVRFRPLNAPPDQTPRYGIIVQDRVFALAESPFKNGFARAKQAFEKALTGTPLAARQVIFLPPVSPSKIIGIGLNYKDHALEQKKPLPELPYVFLKPPSALITSNEAIVLNRHCSEVHYEGELVVVIGRQCARVSEKEAMDHVAGFCIGNDVTDRVIQKKELTFARAKGMDTFAPISHELTTGIDWRSKQIRTWVNGDLKQNGTTDDMIHPVPFLVSFLSQFMTLLPEDIIYTGTPAGVGRLNPGDHVKIGIDEMGCLENPVKSEP